MTRKIVERPYTMDIHGKIKYPEPEAPRPLVAVKDVSIDFLLKKGLSTIEKIISAALVESDSPVGASRETVMNLKDCMSMLHELKKKEDELLESLEDADLEAMIKNDP